MNTCGIRIVQRSHSADAWRVEDRQEPADLSSQLTFRPSRHMSQNCSCRCVCKAFFRDPRFLKCDSFISPFAWPSVKAGCV